MKGSKELNFFYNKSAEICSKVIRIEPKIFFLVLVINCIPLLQYTYFPTLDGPAHCYNTQIIKSLLFDGQSFYADYIQINSELVPNWSGHVFLGILSSVFSMATSEKIVQLLLVIFLPIVFRRLVKSISPDNLMVSYLVFPYTYSIVFLFGFYNFSIALILLFHILNYVIVNYNNISKLKHSITLLFLVFITYFSHALIFLFLVMLVGIYVLFQLINAASNQSLKYKEIANLFLKKLLWGMMIFGLPLFIFFTSQLKESSGNTYDYLPVQELATWIIDFRHLIVYNYTNDVVFTSTIALLIAILTSLVTCFYLYKLATKKIKFKIDYWFVIFVIFSILLFVLPDGTGAGGIISVRILILMFLFLILVLSRLRIPNMLLVPIIIFYLIVNNNLLNQRKADWKEMDKSAIAMRKIATKIDKNSVVLPFNFSQNWMKGHFSNYIGFDKNVMLLENYEVTQTYFPTSLMKNKLPSFQIGDQNNANNCIGWISGNNGVKKIDYIIFEGDIENQTDSCIIKLVQTIQDYYKPIYKVRNITLFEII